MTKKKTAKVDKEAKIQGQVDANAAAVLKAHDEGKSVKELYKMFGIDKGLFCDLVYIVLFKAGRLTESIYAGRAALENWDRCRRPERDAAQAVYERYLKS